MASMADSSLYSSYYTYTYDSLSCYAPMKTVHVVFAYIVCISGFVCFISRMIPSINWMHAWSGRVYVLAMLWATATSLLIFNHGLPTATIVSFVFVMGGLTIGWILIMFHQRLFFQQALERTQELMATGEVPKEASLKQVLEQAKLDVNRRKTFLQRFVSLKTAHGILMFISWINIAGRIFVTNPTEPFYCFSYPVYKPIDTPRYSGASFNGTFTPLPTEAPNHTEVPWYNTGLVGWGLLMSLVPLAFGIIISAVAALIDTRRSRRTSTEQSTLLEEPTQEGAQVVA